MRKSFLVLLFAGTTLVAQQAVFADHNSPFGAGWARMPNDIHNTRIDTLGDNTSFRDFVRYGNGADSTNRYLTESSYTRGSRGSTQGLSGGRGHGMRGNRGGRGQGGGRGGR
jgi:hypothetical protein